MPTNIVPADQQAEFIIVGMVMLLLAIADFIIFCYWISYKFSESSYNQAQRNIANSVPDAQYPMPVPELPALELAVPDLPDTEHLTTEPAVPNTQYSIHVPDLPDTEHLTTEPAIPNTKYLIPVPAPRSPFAASWSLVHPFVGFQLVIVLVNIAFLVFCVPVLPKMVFDSVNFLKSQYALIVTIICLFLQNIGFVCIVAYLVKRYGSSLSGIGLKAPSRREVMLGLIYGAGLIVVSMVVEKCLDFGASRLISKQFVEHMGRIEDQLSAGGMFEHIRSIPIQILFILAAGIAAPIGEELFFRGLLYNAFRKRWGIPAGVILSGICFGLIHLAPISVIVIIPMGCVLAIVYERTRSLWVTILMHAVNNVAQLVMAMYFINSAAHH